jgi:RNA polymerase sigma factor (sigma-70 family)
VINEEDVALSAIHSFFAKLEDGRFPDLHDRDQLWALLASIAAQKAMKARDRQNAKQRGGGNVRGDSALAHATDHIAHGEPGPRELAEFQDLVRHLLDRLREPLRQIAIQRLQGKSEAEIAEQLGVSPRTVARKIARIRDIWEAQHDTTA